MAGQTASRSASIPTGRADAPHRIPTGADVPDPPKSPLGPCKATFFCVESESPLALARFPILPQLPPPNVLFRLYPLMHDSSAQGRIG
jgi:hypothetical protein